MNDINATFSTAT